MTAEKLPTWLYHKTKGGRIHALAPGALPPKGWRDTPWPQDRPEETQEKDKGAVVETVNLP